ncbi:hypothetical protein GALMADRAFT_1061626 [Galerina marginata CBS 339.88]|uniref:Chitin synthase export chaperone n=1 Tax=Galerina marginata (strain CBS 339.88) TaxID=685588 RepID=A0A067SCS7_GALM3|nr:hypothetical protein GALMADRAFT_1061626 [Galerina marginata CBS 339.88]
MWPRKWSSIKSLYFFLRYFPLMAQLPLLLVGSELSPHFHFSHRACYGWQIYQGIVAASVTLSIDIILMLRVHALYHGQRPVRVTVVFFFILEVIGMAVGLGLTLPGVQFDDICAVSYVPRFLAIYGLALMLFQTVLFALTMHKFVQGVKDDWGEFPITKLLIRDGTWAFFLLFFVYVSQLSLYALPNDYSAEVLYSWILSLSSFCGYRILFNLRRLSGGITNPEGSDLAPRPIRWFRPSSWVR